MSPTIAPLFRLAGRLALGLALVPALAAPMAADELVTVELHDGEQVKAERYYPTYTTLVVLTPGASMRLIPNERVKAIGGVPYAQAYWGQETPMDGDRQVPAATAVAAVPEPAAAEPAGLLPLSPGTVRRYDLTGTRTTWVRHGRAMQRNATVELVGVARETVVGAVPEGPVAVRETVVKAPPGQPAEEIQILQLLERRADGTFLVGYGVDDPRVVGDAEAGRIGVPPMLWPAALEVGNTWTVGPFKRLGIFQAGRMQVVARESVTVPAGTYHDAFRVEGFGHVYAGVANMAAGRLITDQGTLTTTTWIVPGVGPVKEERKVHLHQDFFPRGEKGFETPFVVEERTTRVLAEFRPGAAR